jgi:lysine 2,3-aminomutase
MQNTNDNMETYKAKKLDKVAISIRAAKVLQLLLKENPRLEDILLYSKSKEEVLQRMEAWVMNYFESNPIAYKYYLGEVRGRKTLNILQWRDYAAIRLMNYIKHTGRRFTDPNLKYNKITFNDPFRILWLAAKFGTGGAKDDFFVDFLHLFRQFRGDSHPKQITEEIVKEWIDRNPSGLDPYIIKIREQNRDRILKIIIKRIDNKEIHDKKYFFDRELSQEQKMKIASEWWNDKIFHLRFAIKNPDLLNEMLEYSLSPETMQILYDAQKAGIPFFINPYYLSLLHTAHNHHEYGVDLAIRDYILYSSSLIHEFGNISAWEKEDKVKPGKPNAAGWLLPEGHNVHRRYPEVAILIPDTTGRACGGLCTSCQRMYDFQKGNLNFDLDKLKPQGTWWERLETLMQYFEKDTQLRDILITGGDALMSSDKALERILEAIYQMALRKKENNKKKNDGEKYAEIVRIRLGTRLPVYLPQRISEELCSILKAFKEKAKKIGIRQFVIQTHFESAMEITPESKKAIESLHKAGWIVTNQLVFTTAASRRGHTAKLRQSLNRIGVLPYYTFTVKGFLENKHNYAPIARVVQEQREEKYLGKIPGEEFDTIKNFAEEAEKINDNIDLLKKKLNIPFLATDRSVLNLPGVGKSLTFKVIGLTRYGKRIIEFDHDQTRPHSPIIEKMGKIYVIESKSMFDYQNQLENIGEDFNDYMGLYGYSMGETEKRHSIYEYPEYDFNITDTISNLKI